jgi:Arc/MetJ-type ribon-helix-helix transcriptional regulator
MTVTLSKNAEAYVAAQMMTGEYASPDDVVNEMVLGSELPACSRTDGTPMNEAELEEELLKAVRGPHGTWRGRAELDEIRARVLKRRGVEA